MKPTEISEGERYVPILKIELPRIFPALVVVATVPTAIEAFHIPKPCPKNFKKPPRRDDVIIVLILLLLSKSDSKFSFIPASNIAAVATPSGYFNFAFNIKALRSGTVKRTPIMPPIAEILATSR